MTDFLKTLIGDGESKETNIAEVEAYLNLHAIDNLNEIAAIVKKAGNIAILYQMLSSSSNKEKQRENLLKKHKYFANISKELQIALALKDEMEIEFELPF